jgi:hypothetical protein
MTISYAEYEPETSFPALGFAFETAAAEPDTAAPAIAEPDIVVENVIEFKGPSDSEFTHKLGQRDSTVNKVTAHLKGLQARSNALAGEFGQHASGVRGKAAEQAWEVVRQTRSNGLDTKPLERVLAQITVPVPGRRGMNIGQPSPFRFN